MSRLILDFLARRWWVLLITLFISIMVIATGQAIPFTPILLVVLILDAQRGLIRTVRPLPISRRAQVAAWWLIGVPLGSLVTAIGNPVGAFIYQARHVAPQLVPLATPDAPLPYAFVPAPDYFSPWFVAAIVTWLGLGYTALCFLLCIALPTRTASNPFETIWQGVVGALWGLSMSGPMLFMFIVPKNPGMVHPWHWWIVALVPVLVLLSLLAAPDMADRRMSTLTAGAKPVAAPAEKERRGLTGSALFLSSAIGRALVILAFLGAIQLAVGRFTHPGVGNPSFALQMVVFAIIFGVIPGETTGMRVLRALPLSARRLAALLLTVPMTLGFACAAFIYAAGTMVQPVPSGPIAFFAAAFVTGGAGALALATSLHIVSAARIFLLMFFAFIPAFAFYLVSGFALWVLLGGVAAMGIAFLMLERGLRRSNAFYQPRRFFGLSLGQQLAGR